jgi:hypothetical protein
MSNSSDNFKTISLSEGPTRNKAQEIFKRSLMTSYQVDNTKEKFSNSNNFLNSRDKKLNILRKLSILYLRKSLSNLTRQQFYKGLYNKAFKKFYKGYKLSVYSFLLFINLNSLKKINRLKKTYYDQKNFYKAYFKIIYPKINLLDIYLIKNLTLIKYFGKKLLNLFFLLKLDLSLKYEKNLRLYSSSSNILNFFYQVDNKLLRSFYKIVTLLQKQVKDFIINNKVNNKLRKFKNIFDSNITQIKKLIDNLKGFFLSLICTDKKHFASYLERIILICSIYFLPFLFLATQALVPVIDEYEYVIINPITSTFFNKIPFLIDLIKMVRPIITNPMLLFWVPLGYYLTFTSAYRSLNISYKVAYNGTLAAIFLIINYSCVLMQFMMKLAFDSGKIINDIFFTSYLIKHLGKNKNKERDEAMKIFASLVKRYDSEIRRNYYDFLLLINHRIFSHLALISLAALVYNCIYYIVHNKNPEILLVTKTALATIKNPQEEE